MAGRRIILHVRYIYMVSSSFDISASKKHCQHELRIRSVKVGTELYEYTRPLYHSCRTPSCISLKLSHLRPASSNSHRACCRCKASLPNLFSSLIVSIRTRMRVLLRIHAGPFRLHGHRRFAIDIIKILARHIVAAFGGVMPVF